MTSLEGPAASWILSRLGPAGRWIARQVRRDHAAIAARQMLPVHSYDAFCLFVSVAPSDTVRSKSVVDFVDAAHAVVHSGLGAFFTDPADYSGPELVRYAHPLDRGPGRPQSIICVYPTGLIELKWVLASPPETDLPLGQISEMIKVLHQLVASDAYLAIYRNRRFEKWRRVDWRIGTNGSAVWNGGVGSPYWTSLVTPVALPTARVAAPRPSCPRDGYAAGQLTSIRRSGQLNPFLVPVIEELLLSAGYTNKKEIERCASAVASLPGSVGRGATC